MDAPFRDFSRSLGPAESRPGEMHLEISSGFIPHRRSATASPAPDGQTWRQASDVDLTGFVDRFDQPPVGVRALAMGHWIIDCGHDNFQTELHPLSFLSWVHTSDSDGTTAIGYVNPYRDSETYAAQPSVPPKPFPLYLTEQLTAVATGGADHLQSKEIVSPVAAAPPPWQVCATNATTVAYDIVTRPGVSVNVSSPSGGCVTVTVQFGPDYKPAPVVTRQCRLPWDYLDEVTKASLDTDVDVKALIDKQVPAPLQARIDREPDTSCADPLAGPDVALTPPRQQIHVDGTQPFPFYGVVKVGP